MYSTDDFHNELLRMMAKAQKAGKQFVEIEADELNTRVGGYPEDNDGKRRCCEAMKAQFAPILATLLHTNLAADREHRSGLDTDCRL